MLMTSLNLKRGWNLVAYPWQQAEAVKDGLQLIGGVDAQGRNLYTTIYGHVVTDTLNPWRVYDIDAPDWVNDLAQLQYGKGYWINATTATPNAPAAKPQRATPSADAALTLPPATYYGVAPDVGLQVRALVGGRECGQRTTTAIQTLDQRRVPAFSIKVPAAGPGTPGCGTAAAPFTIEFLKGTTVVKSIPLAWDNNRVHRVSQLYLPLAVRGGSIPGSDLIVTGIVVLPAAPQAGKPTEVRISIRNAGTTDVGVPFWVDMYVDPRAMPQVNQIWPQLSDLGASWRVYGLKAGETRVLSTLAPNDPLDPNANYSNFETFIGAGIHRVFVLSDSFSSSQAGGAVTEINEGNNMLGPVGVTVSDGTAAIQTVAPPRIDERPSR
jgi:hypothetical protein